jgi:hypothetical protein
LFRKHVTVASQQFVVRHWSHAPCIAVPPSGGVSNVNGSSSMLHVAAASSGAELPTGAGPEGVEDDPVAVPASSLAALAAPLPLPPLLLPPPAYAPLFMPWSVGVWA